MEKSVTANGAFGETEKPAMLTEQQQELFTRLWTQAQPEVSRYIASLIPDSSAAGDIVQATSLTLVRKFSEYDPQRPFLPWALGVAKYEILGHRRDAARSRIVFDTDFVDRYTETWAEVAPGISDQASALRHCLKKLPDRQRKVINLRYAEDLNSDDIGQRLNITSMNVRTILKRTREILRRCVEKHLIAEGGTK